jgi:hypothetical protein
MRFRILHRFLLSHGNDFLQLLGRIRSVGLLLLNFRLLGFAFDC